MDQKISRELIDLTGAGAEFARQDFTYPIGDAALVDGGLLWAELGALDQHHVHFDPAIELRPHGPMFDLYSAGNFVGTIEAMTERGRERHRWGKWCERRQGTQWREFFEQQAAEVRAYSSP